MDDPFEITADEIHYDNRRSLYVADRHVRVEQGARSLRARWIAFSTETRLGVAEGNVELIEDGNRLNAEFMIFNVDTLQGTLYQGELDAGRDGFYIQAQELIRTGDDTFAMRDGIFTTCRCEEGERVPWTLSAAKADVEMGGYGTLTNSTFNVLGVPVLWIPWIFFPVKSERETGFLLPDFQFGGRGGFGDRGGYDGGYGGGGGASGYPAPHSFGGGGAQGYQAPNSFGGGGGPGYPAPHSFGGGANSYPAPRAGPANGEGSRTRW